MKIKLSKLCLTCISACIIFGSPLWSAAPVSHAYITKRFFQYFPKYNKEEQKAFMIGTLFADIRYLGEASRQETHLPDITLEDVLREKSPFLAGLKFHSYVDEVREQFVLEQGIYKYIATITPQHKSTYLKLLEDEYIYSFYDWQEWADALQVIEPEELDWGMEENTIRKWHNLVSVCLLNPPSTILFLLNATKTGFLNIPIEEVALWNKKFTPSVRSKEFRVFVKAMFNHFEFLMKQQQDELYQENFGVAE